MAALSVPGGPPRTTGTAAPLSAGRRDVAVGEVAPLAAGGGVFGLHARYGVRFQAGAALVVLVHAHGVAGENGGLHRAVGGAERGEAVTALHVLRDLQAGQHVELPLRRAGPDRVRAPDHVVGAEALHQDARERGGQARLHHRRLREYLAEVAVHVRHAILFRNLGEVAGPLDAAGALELRQALLGGAAAGEAVSGVV